MDEKSLRVGITAVLCALVFRLYSPGLLSRAEEFLTQPDTVSFLIYLETGRDVRFSSSCGVFYPPESRQPVIPPPPPLPRWEDARGVEVYYACPLRPDLDSLMAQPLCWDLDDGSPRVLILHTHTTESYDRGALTYPETAPYRTLEEDYNVLSVGDRLAELLSSRGIATLHDREFHDYPSYNGSYAHSRRAFRSYLKEYPGLRLILDIHRDAWDTGAGQMRTLCSIGGRDAAQLMIVVGTDAGGLRHPRWQENLSLALKLHAQLEALCPGIMRPLCLRSQRFNQDLSPGALLIEVGAAGNSHEEAMLAVEQLALGIRALAAGANPIQNTADPIHGLCAEPGAVRAG